MSASCLCPPEVPGVCSPSNWTLHVSVQISVPQYSLSQRKSSCYQFFRWPCLSLKRWRRLPGSHREQLLISMSLLSFCVCVCVNAWPLCVFDYRMHIMIPRTRWARTIRCLSARWVHLLSCVSCSHQRGCRLCLELSVSLSWHFVGFTVNTPSSLFALKLLWRNSRVQSWVWPPRIDA